MRRLLVAEQPDALLGGIVGVSVTKLMLKREKPELKGVLLLCSLAKLLQGKRESKSLALKDNRERVLFCLKLAGSALRHPETKPAALQQLFSDPHFAMLRAALPAVQA